MFYVSPSSFNQNLKKVWQINHKLVLSKNLKDIFKFKTQHGIWVIANDDFQQINGMSTRYWGLRNENDEFKSRIHKHGLKIHRLENMKAEDSYSLLDFNQRGNKPRCLEESLKVKIPKLSDGLTTAHYSINFTRDFTVEGVKATILNIYVGCDVHSTPWCICSEV